MKSIVIDKRDNTAAILSDDGIVTKVKNKKLYNRTGDRHEKQENTYY